MAVRRTTSTFALSSLSNLFASFSRMKSGCQCTKRTPSLLCTGTTRVVWATNRRSGHRPNSPLRRDRQGLCQAILSGLSLRCWHWAGRTAWWTRWPGDLSRGLSWQLHSEVTTDCNTTLGTVWDGCEGKCPSSLPFLSRNPLFRGVSRESSLPSSVPFLSLFGTVITPIAVFCFFFIDHLFTFHIFGWQRYE